MTRVGKTSAMVGVGQQGVSPVIKGRDTGGPAVRIGVLGYFGRYDEGSGGAPIWGSSVRSQGSGQGGRPMGRGRHRPLSKSYWRWG